LQWLLEKAKGPDLLCVVLFRGTWCKYDRHYIPRLGRFLKSRGKAEGQVTLVAWTSEGADAAKKADEDWKLTSECGYEAILGDETNALPKYLSEDEILPDLKIMTPEEANVSALVSGGSYPNGIAMPGIVWYAHHGSAPVFEWVHPCKAPGLGGPDRPEPVDMWEEVIKRKHALDNGKDIMPSHGSNIRMCTNDFDAFITSCQIL